MFRRSAASLAKSLVVAEILNGKYAPATLSAVTAAAKCGSVSILVGGQGAKAVAGELAKIAGVTEVFATEADHYAHGLPEEFSDLIETTVKDNSFTHVIGASSAFTKNAIPRVAAKFDSMPISDVTAITDGGQIFERQIYAGNVVSNVKSNDSVKFITVRSTSFDKAVAEGGSGTVKDAKDGANKGSAKWVEDLIITSDKPELTAASIVISGGRGLKKGENFKLLEDLAAPLKAAVGATRAVVDAGFCPNEMQVGQTGKIVAPNLYVAIGLSGAIQHIAGMKDSKFIACINTDADAPIFQVSDYGLQADLFDAVPKLTEKLK
eukprot:Tbor_TRINITY_DN2996_c0_g2::TRINITY_DN2996_c0_g2_i1::g.1113::m.1113/K03522/fixB, etfA; electron transfer flavoprotein alpha subunit